MSDTTEPTPCRVCGNDRNNRLHRAREMMYGTQEPFDYLECGACGCVQLLAVPDDMSPWYPDDYCAYGSPKEPSDPAWVLNLRAARTRFYQGHPGLLGKLSAALAREPYFLDWMGNHGLELDARILDIGCGTGAFLLRLARDGFNRLEGLEPFIDADLHYDCGVVVRKRTIAEMEGEFDFVMMHHSFEHVPDPQDVLKTIHAHLAPGGKLLIRIPLAGSWAWRKYGTDWVNLDAPRHIYLHTPRSLHLLAKEAGFRVTRTAYDSNFKQIAESEMIRRDVHMRAYEAEAHKVFLAKDIEAMKRFAEDINRRHDGDMAAFILERRND